jgi:hypothetical protein
MEAMMFQSEPVDHKAIFQVATMVLIYSDMARTYG